jgi:hypothetical protein
VTGVREREPDSGTEAEALAVEIAGLRKRLLAALADDNADMGTIAQGANALTRMVATQYRLSPRAAHDFAEKLLAALDGLGDLLLPADR